MRYKPNVHWRNSVPQVTSEEGALEIGVKETSQEFVKIIAMTAAQIAERDAAEDEAFREQCRRQMERPLSARMKYGFCRINRPVLDTPGIRIFNSTREYREWCAANLPAYLGFQPAPE